MSKRESLVGQRFGQLTVLSQTTSTDSGRRRWICRCDCGKEAIVTTAHLTGGSTTSCGNHRKGVNLLDISGQRFGRLIAIAPTNNTCGHSVIWECRCDCGRIAYVASTRLRKGETKSCGCLNLEDKKEKSKIMRKVRDVDYIDGTDIQGLLQKPRARNTSGVVGVSYDVSVGQWKAHITFKGHRYFLGSGRDKEHVIALRREAEKRIHGEFLEWYYTEYPERRPPPEDGAGPRK